MGRGAGRSYLTDECLILSSETCEAAGRCQYSTDMKHQADCLPNDISTPAQPAATSQALKSYYLGDSPNSSEMPSVCFGFCAKLTLPGFWTPPAGLLRTSAWLDSLNVGLPGARPCIKSSREIGRLLCHSKSSDARLQEADIGCVLCSTRPAQLTDQQDSSACWAMPARTTQRVGSPGPAVKRAKGSRRPASTQAHRHNIVAEQHQQSDLYPGLGHAGLKCHLTQDALASSNLCSKHHAVWQSRTS